MFWVPIVWAMIASACFTLALIHAIVFLRQRRAVDSAMLSLAAVGTAGLAGCELWMMRAQSPGEFLRALMWIHVPAWLAMLAVVGFLRAFLHAGRPWLAWSVVVVRTLSLVINFAVAPHFNFQGTPVLGSYSMLGEMVSVAEGAPSRWMLLGQFAFLLWVIFILDVTIEVWRRGERRRALVVGGSMLFFALSGTGQAVLILWGVLNMPITASVFFLGTVLAMSYELSNDLLRAAQLSRDLRQSEDRMKLAASAASLGLWEWDVAADKLWATDEVRRRLGKSDDAALDFNSYLSRVHEDDRPAVEAAIREALAGGRDYEYEYRLRADDGSVRWMSVRGAVERDETGSARMVRGVSLDITARKQSESKLEQQREELAHLSRVAMLGELSGSLAHELSQPLAAILANTEAAELHLQSNEPNLAELRSILADVRKDDQRAGEILHGMRDFLRRRPLNPEPLDVADFLDGVLRLLGAEAAARKIKIGLAVEPGLPRLLGEQIYLQQVLVNLLINGMDAMSGSPPPNAQITVSAHSANGHGVAISVIDAGCGVPEAELARVFEPFHTTKRGGLGLGLPICRAIIESHGGTIRLANNPSRGATVEVTLPAA